MMNAPSPIKKEHFDELYACILLGLKINRRKLEVEAKELKARDFAAD